MIQITIKDVLEGNIAGIPDQGIYVFRDGDCVLYVGKSIHVLTRLKEQLRSISALTDLIEANKPSSLFWQIEVMTVEECRLYALKERPNGVYLNLDTAEGVIIRHHQPCLNGSLNLNRGKLPAHIKRHELIPGETDNLY